MNFSKELAQRYEVVRLIGKGQMGEVCLARDLVRNEMVAIKTVKESVFQDQDAQQRFLREARITSALSHPNIIRCIDQGKDSGHLYIVLEYVEGGPMGKYMREHGPFTAPVFCQIAVGILDAVAYAHRSNVLHRDLKSDNILLDRDLQPRIADFGLAKGGESDGLETIAGTMMGTPLYMAPELARGQKATAATDQYAVGVVLYWMLAGKPPLFAENPLEMLQLHVDQVPPLVTTHRPEVPHELATALHRALAKDPGARWPEVAALRDVVNSLAASAASGWKKKAAPRADEDVGSRTLQYTIDPEPPPVAASRPPAPVAASQPPAAASHPPSAATHPPTLVGVPAPQLPRVTVKSAVAQTQPPVAASHPPVAASHPPAPAPQPRPRNTGQVPAQPASAQTPPPAPIVAAPTKAPAAGGQRTALRVVAVLIAVAITVWSARASKSARGALGLSPGQPCTISGTVDAGPSPDYPPGTPLVRVESVNGVALAKPVVIPFYPPAGKPAPAAGTHVELTGFESSAFVAVK